jgi:hypothetical protein
MEMHDFRVMYHQEAVTLRSLRSRMMGGQQIEAKFRDEELRCWECGYRLTGLTSGRCPECGHNVDPSDPLHAWFRDYFLRHHARRPELVASATGLGLLAAVLIPLFWFLVFWFAERIGFENPYLGPTGSAVMYGFIVLSPVAVDIPPKWARVQGQFLLAPLFTAIGAAVSMWLLTALAVPFGGMCLELALAGAIFALFCLLGLTVTLRIHLPRRWYIVPVVGAILFGLAGLCVDLSNLSYLGILLIPLYLATPMGLAAACIWVITDSPIHFYASVYRRLDRDHAG